MTPQQWPAGRDFQEAIQNPSYCFTDAELRCLLPASDKLGMPLVTSGQFAYVFKLDDVSGMGAQAIRCFRGFLGDRQQRYQAIDRHLDRTSIPCVASFDYNSEGIIVLGRKYPILVMEWINGVPLDVYIGDVFQRPDVLKYLAELWLKVIKSLKDASVAHGDLQHGNIMVQNGKLRLVDLDGMFVPEMAGWLASELGHQHYQHPQRSPQHFGIGLDNFSALVIYISFLAMAEFPELWREFHDENLIFTSRDFKEPSSSKLFSKLRKVGNVRRLVTTLEAACRRDPLQCPDLLDLVSLPSKLPSWMREAPVVQTRTLTREAQTSSGPPPPVPPQSVAEPGSAPQVPWWRQSPGLAAPPSPAGTATAPNLAPSTPAVQPSPMVSLHLFSRPVLSKASHYTFAWLVWVWLWFPALFAVFWKIGMSAKQAAVIPLACYLICCHLMAYLRVSRGAQTSKRMSRGSPTAFVGNRVSQVYHLPSCAWANKIRARNVVSFVSAAQATGRGFRPCGVCRP
jgi:serine/threonine protein kinase